MRFGLTLLTVALAACTGTLDGPGIPRPAGSSDPSSAGSQAEPGPEAPDVPPSTTGGSGAGAPAVEMACASVNAGSSVLGRLTRAAYDSAVQSLLNTKQAPADGFVPDDKLLGYSAGLSISPLLVDQYASAAESLAAEAVQDLPALMACDPRLTEEPDCAFDFIDRFGKLAFRRPLSTDEQGDLRTLYATANAEWGTETAVELLLQAVLQSPQFLYHVELGTPVVGNPELVALTSHELLSRMTFLLWGTTPDQALLESIAGRDLSEVDGVAELANEMLADPRARVSVRRFHDEWLELEKLARIAKDPDVYPAFDDALAADMAEETQRFAEFIAFDRNGTVADLLTTPVGFVTDGLAAVYGVAKTDSAEVAQVELDTDTRAGLLTQASILTLNAKANQSSPVHRGKFVRERLLCQPLDPPPANLAIIPPDPDPNATTRERFAEHSVNPECARCHVMMDPLGFGFERYDGIGRYRQTEGSLALPIDASGELRFTTDADGTFDGVPQLAGLLAGSEQVQQCFATQWFAYAFGRDINNDFDDCSKAQIMEAFSDAGYEIKALLLALVTSDAFRFRRIPQGGTAP